MKKRLDLQAAIEKAGGVAEVSRALGRDMSVVWRWNEANALPGVKQVRQSRKAAETIAQLAGCRPEDLLQ